ncbi:MAG: hypothetical protein H7306_04335, partial [Bacteriovorax sp.]|nr:hypothetical protein [Rhizobacter sp.]
MNARVATAVAQPAVAAAIPKASFDWFPLALGAGLQAGALPLISSPSTAP